MRENDILYTLQVEEKEAGQRIDHWLALKFVDSSRSQIKKWIQQGCVSLDNKLLTKGSTLLRFGQTVTVGGFEDDKGELKPAEIELDILYEDDEILVINKQAGVVVHPGAGIKSTTLVEGVLFHVGRLSGGDSIRPGVVHRLDKDTTGAIVFAKNETAHRSLAKQFEEKSNKREYVAILDGHMATDQLAVESYLHRDPENRLKFRHMDVGDYENCNMSKGKGGFRWAKSEFIKKLDFRQRLTLCFVRLHTGRTHQIRVHAKQVGMPIIGDQLYNNQTTLPSEFDLSTIDYVKKIDRQMLHARTLGINHPKSGEAMSFEAPLPGDFKELLEHLRPHAAV